MRAQELARLQRQVKSLRGVYSLVDPEHGGALVDRRPDDRRHPGANQEECKDGDQHVKPVPDRVPDRLEGGPLVHSSMRLPKTGPTGQAR